MKYFRIKIRNKKAKLKNQTMMTNRKDKQCLYKDQKLLKLKSIKQNLSESKKLWKIWKWIKINKC
jgi:hypothetical protein